MPSGRSRTCSKSVPQASYAQAPGNLSSPRGCNGQRANRRFGPTQPDHQTIWFSPRRANCDFQSDGCSSGCRGNRERFLMCLLIRCPKTATTFGSQQLGFRKYCGGDEQHPVRDRYKFGRLRNHDFRRDSFRQWFQFCGAGPACEPASRSISKLQRVLSSFRGRRDFGNPVAFQQARVLVGCIGRNGR